ncbi:MAG: septal ring lytic transglycosylase RlpA family protein [Trueperaceae bacterium]
MHARAFVRREGPVLESHHTRGVGLAALALAAALSACAPAALMGQAPGTPSGAGPIDTSTAIADAAFAPAATTSSAARPRTNAATAARPSPAAERGMASWYGPGFAGRLTANGEIFDPSQLTAAHKTLPFNTLVRVVNEDNGRSVVVRINDRGPFKPGRVIDLSRAGAEAMGMVGAGVARVRLELLTLPDGVVRVAAAGALRDFDVVSRLHAVGTLFVLEPRVGGAPVVVRVVGQDVPADVAADVLVGYELFAVVGSEAHLHDD